MNAGRELDALVAEKVMGLMRQVRLKGETNSMTIYTDNPYFSDGQCSKDELLRYAMPLHYSTSIADAWQVVEKLHDEHAFTLEYVGSWFVAQFWSNNKKVISRADTAPLAICLAALKAVGVAVE